MRTNAVALTLRHANLSYLDFGYSDLSFADLKNTNLCMANLSRTNLYHADLRGASLTGAILPEGVPTVSNINKAILNAVNGKGIEPREWSAWTILVAGGFGLILSKRVGELTAAALIYAKSQPDLPVPDFFVGVEGMIAYLKAHTAL